MQLIISTGDICDVDGLLALALYAKSGADLLYIMNYPAYVGIENGVTETERTYGLGYTYDTETFQSGSMQGRVDDARFKSYTELMAKYDVCSRDPRVKLKQILTDMAFHLTSTTWMNGERKDSQQFFFCVGGVNDINPYSSTNSINEAYIYAPALKGIEPLGSCSADFLVDMHRAEHNIDNFLQGYERIYMDFNGTAAFFDSKWHNRLLGCIERKQLKAFFVQGGVLAYEEPHTLPRMRNKINRMGCATMNQLYSPAKTGNLLRLMEENLVPVFIVPNNSVENLQERWALFMAANKVNYYPLSEYTNLFYTSTFQIAAKPYDLYSALALVEHIKSGNLTSFSYPKTLFFNSTYGISLLHEDGASWDDARSDYIVNMRKKVAGRKEKEIVEDFETEARILASAGCLSYMVSLVSFELDEKKYLSLLATRPTLILLKNEVNVFLNFSDSVLLIDDGSIKMPAQKEIEWIMHHVLVITPAGQQVSDQPLNDSIVAKSIPVLNINNLAVLRLAINADDIKRLNNIWLSTRRGFKKLCPVKLDELRKFTLDDSTSKAIHSYISSETFMDRK
jgi:hypothetical protein